MIRPTNEVIMRSDFDHLPLWGNCQAIEAISETGDADVPRALTCTIAECDADALPGNSFCANCLQKGNERLRVALTHAEAYPNGFTPLPPRATIRPRPVRPKTPLHVREARLARRDKRRANVQKVRLFLVGFSVMPGALIAGYFLPILRGWAFVGVALVALLTMLAALAFLMLITGILHRPRTMPSPEPEPTQTGTNWRKSRKRRHGERGRSTRLDSKSCGKACKTDETSAAR